MIRVVNVFDDALLAADATEPDGYRAAQAKLAPLVGGDAVRGAVALLQPGEAVCPYHYELAEEEWLVVLAGTPSVRTPDGERELAPRDVVCFPLGPDGAHKVFNASDAPARVLLLSDHAVLSGAVYPDGEPTVGLFGPHVDAMFRTADERGYFDDEPRA